MQRERMRCRNACDKEINWYLYERARERYVLLGGGGWRRGGGSWNWGTADWWDGVCDLCMQEDLQCFQL